MINLSQLSIPAIIFFIVASLILILSYFWNDNLSSRARARRKRLSEFTDYLRFNQNKLELSIARDGDAGVFEHFSQKLPGFDRLELLLMRAGSNKSPLQILIYSLLIFLFIYLSLSFSSVNQVSAIISAILISLLPFLFLIRQKNKRRIKFEEQLPDALDFISRALLSGHGLSFAFTMVGDEFPNPLGEEFKKASDEINLGLSFGNALSGLSNRLISSDLNFFVVSLMIQRDTGGNLSDLLSSISFTIRERLKLKGKVRILASEAKLSAIILILLPFFLALILSIINYEYMSLLWTTPKGHKLLFLTMVMIPFGVLWMRKIIRIKV
ncbi:MAG: hypothetical protein RLZ10_2833 [Bacteroidota bacterium]|jgi:tight adherence protein B